MQQQNHLDEISHLHIGQLGEDMAAKFLRAKGWMIKARNWHARQFGIAGELDLICVDPQRTLVAVEVKTRSNQSCGGTKYAISALKIAKIRALLAVWIANEEEKYASVRVDAILVQIHKNRVTIEHMKAIK